MYFLKLKNSILGKIYIKKKGVYFKYSANEQWTGEYWIDGKKIYTKTIYQKIGTSGDSGTITIPHNIQNIGDFSAIDFNHSFWIAGNYKWAFNSKENSEYISLIRIGNSVLYAQTSSGWSGFYGYITLRYTKTTD